MNPNLKTAVERAGGVSALARIVSVPHSAIYNWKRGIPPKHVPAISAALGIPRHELRPDLWEPPANDSGSAA